ncbi:hypothetical protein ACFC00_15420, partial [Streptomyces adustus]|uniref:hypothetical protein n=1 Tax=Streptomyces adustus TaxID=1609272 RepID=UPI0035E125FC
MVQRRAGGVRRAASIELIARADIHLPAIRCGRNRLAGHHHGRTTERQAATARQRDSATARQRDSATARQRDSATARQRDSATA